MPIPIAFLLSMQAAGMVIDYMGTEDTINQARNGAELEKASINANIVTSRLQAEQASLDAMQKLRQNLGSQAALMAARGTRAGAGTAVSFGNESTHNFNTDERIRNINQMNRETELKAGLLLSKLHQNTFETNAWNSFAQRTINKIPTNPSTYESLGSSFGLTKVKGG